SLTWFEGHFPGHPVLPGVVQVHVASTIGRGLFEISDAFIGIDGLKFQRLITPGHQLRLELEFEIASGKLTFEFHDAEGRCSAGRVLFAS
ncbi:MAG: 3-hydroxyacyl-ACP dehydratase FabZ family protein, partial [Gammaproteobacteria bacterium]